MRAWLLWALTLLLSGCGGGGEDVGTAESETDSAPDFVFGSIYQTNDAPRFVQCAYPRIVWVEHDSGDLRSANLDGSGVTTLVPAFAPALNNMKVRDGLVIAAITGAMGSVRTVPVWGGAVNVIQAPYAFAADVRSGVVYWVDQEHISSQLGPLVEVDQGRALGADASSLYWIELGDDAVMRYPPGEALAYGLEFRYTSLTVGAAKIYWSHDDGIYWRFKLDGPPVRLSFDRADFIVPLILNSVAWYGPAGVEIDEVTVSTLGAPSGLAACGGYLYWSSWLGQIRRAPL